MSRQLSNRRGEVLRDNNVVRFASYFNNSPDAVRALEKAYREGDNNNMRRIIAANTKEDFLEPLLSIDAYDPLTMEVTKKILSANVVHLSKTGMRQAEIGAYEPEVKPFKRERAARTSEYVEQEQKKSRKKYKRAKPTRYSKRELTFLERNKDKSNSELIRTYNEYFPQRSKSSLISKAYRIRKRKAKK